MKYNYIYINKWLFRIYVKKKAKYIKHETSDIVKLGSRYNFVLLWLINRVADFSEVGLPSSFISHAHDQCSFNFLLILFYRFTFLNESYVDKT